MNAESGIETADRWIERINEAMQLQVDLCEPVMTFRLSRKELISLRMMVETAKEAIEKAVKENERL